MKTNYGWRPIKTAPRNGKQILITGHRFISKKRYYAIAKFATRKCPAKVSGWFPPDNDGGGDYQDVTHWMPLPRSPK